MLFIMHFFKLIWNSNFEWNRKLNFLIDEDTFCLHLLLNFFLRNTQNPGNSIDKVFLNCFAEKKSSRLWFFVQFNIHLGEKISILATLLKLNGKNIALLYIELEQMKLNEKLFQLENFYKFILHKIKTRCTLSFIEYSASTDLNFFSE